MGKNDGNERIECVEEFVRVKSKRLKIKLATEMSFVVLSGGVDSSVAAALVHRAIGDQLTCIFVDHGLLKK